MVMRFDARAAIADAEEEMRWVCRMCDTMIERDDEKLCRRCKRYDDDCRNGLFDP